LKKKQNEEKPGYIAWKENASSSSSGSNDEEEENLYLMANEEVDSNVGASDFDQLLDAFNEMHEEVQKLSLANNFLKGKLRWHVDKITSIKKKLLDLKKENGSSWRSYEWLL